MVKKIDQQLKNLKNFRISYELVLCDNYLAKLLEKYYTIHMKLLRDWGDYNEK